MASDFLRTDFRGPSPVQAKVFRATIVTIHFVNKALHRVKKEIIITGLTSQCVLATLKPFSLVE